jgi:DNA-binding transcriptional regulator YdaS (Cro superfamily)
MSVTAPDPVPADYVRHLCNRVGGQLAAARLLHVDGRTVRKWVAGDRTCPWASAELLRILACNLAT